MIIGICSTFYGQQLEKKVYPFHAFVSWPMCSIGHGNRDPKDEIFNLDARAVKRILGCMVTFIFVVVYERNDSC